jgi:hypothetical protein
LVEDVDDDVDVDLLLILVIWIPVLLNLLDNDDTDDIEEEWIPKDETARIPVDRRKMVWLGFILMFVPRIVVWTIERLNEWANWKWG